MICSRRGQSIGKDELMNILVVVPWYKPIIGGVVLAVERKYKALVKKGNSVILLTAGNYNRITYTGKDDDIPIYAFYRRFFCSKKHPVKAAVGCMIWLIPTVVLLNRFIKEKRIDVVILEYPEASNFYFTILKWFNRIKYTVSFNGSDINLLSGENWVVRRSIMCQTRNANGVIAVSQMLMRTVAAVVKRLPDHHEVIYSGIDPQWALSGSDVTYDLPEKYILTLAWADPIKGPDILIRAFAKLTNEYPDVYLVMIGSGPIEDELRELIKSLGIKDRVTRLGDVPHDNLPAIYQGTLFGVIPSRNEGLPVVSLEFQLFKKAIIASNVGGLPESIVDDFNGCLVPPGDVDALAEKIKYMIDNPEVCRRLGDNGFGYVRSHFDQEMMAEHYHQFLGGIVDEA